MVLKPFSPLLPEPCQYLGLEVVLACALQFFFALRLFRLLLGPNPVAIFLYSLFVLTALPLSARVIGHFALTNQWLVVAALLVYFQAQEQSPRAVRRFVVSALVLAAVAVATNPYIAFQVLLVLTAAAGSLLWQRRLPVKHALGFMAALGATSAVVAYSLGFFIAGSEGYMSPGYRFLAMNLLTPVSPFIFGSTVCGAILSRLLPNFPHSTTVEGGNYLGAGIIFLAIFLLIAFVDQRRKRPTLDRRRLFPLLWCCLVLTLMALSTRIMIGPRVLVDLDPQQHLTRFLGLLRASDRLFWVPFYAILTAVLAAPFLLFRRSQANLLLAIVLVVQLVDLAPFLHLVRSMSVRPPLNVLHSPLWSQLGSMHENLIVLPPWQCHPRASPGKKLGFQIFGFLAVEQRMTTNSYYSGRYTKANFDFHCKQSIAALANEPLSPDSAYVVTPALAEVIAKGPTGPGKCHEVDGFVLCSVKLDFGATDGPVPASQ